MKKFTRTGAFINHERNNKNGDARHGSVSLLSLSAVKTTARKIVGLMPLGAIIIMCMNKKMLFIVLAKEGK